MGAARQSQSTEISGFLERTRRPPPCCFIRSIAYADGKAGAETDWTEQLGNPGSVTSFGLDAAGELYVMTADGELLKLVPRT